MIYNMNVENIHKKNIPCINLKKELEICDEVIKVWQNKEKLMAEIVWKVEISQSSVAWIPKKQRYKNVNLIWKSDLTLFIKKTICNFSKKWKNEEIKKQNFFIWIDQTNRILYQQHKNHWIWNEI